MVISSSIFIAYFVKKIDSFIKKSLNKIQSSLTPESLFPECYIFVTASSEGVK